METSEKPSAMTVCKAHPDLYDSFDEIKPPEVSWKMAY
jgi:hypothetical protein